MFPFPVVGTASRCLGMPHWADAQVPWAPTRLTSSTLKAILAAGAVAFGRKRRTSLRYRDAGGCKADWDLADIESWQLRGVYRDPSDPRQGSVQLYFDAGCKQARMVHSEYGPVPVDLQVITKPDGCLA